MLPVRRSPDTKSNWSFRKDETDHSLVETNFAWIERERTEHPPFCRPGDVVLLGGSSLADFRIRVAQSHMRHDLTPSYWSLVGVVSGPNRFLTAPLWPLPEPQRVPLTNGIQSLALSAFDDPQAWPNIAVVRFPGTQRSPVRGIGRLRSQRSIVDIPTLLLPWLGFVWGAGTAGNPLLGGYGVPSAVLVETAFGLAEVELTPGLAAANSCPEAIYQSAKWWSGFYQKTAGYQGEPGPASPSEADEENHPVGRYLLRQKQATYVDPK